MQRFVTPLALAFLMAGGALAQANRVGTDVIWARDIGSATITVDGSISEPVWQQAERYPIVWNGDHPLPGGGQWIEENPGGLVDPLDPPSGFAYVLRKGNELFLAFQIEDESIGGTRTLFKHDGILMQLLRPLDRPEVFTDRDDFFDGTIREEMFYGWFHPNAADTTAGGMPAAGIGPRAWSTDFGTTFGDSSDATPRNPEAWEYATTVDGVSNDDFNGGASFTADNGYVMEMRIRLDSLGWDLTQPMSRMPFTFAVQDQDYRWPTNADAYTNVRVYWQWRYLNNYETGVGYIAGDPSVTVSSGPVPAYTEPEFTVPNGANTPEPTIDGVLDEPSWANLDPQFRLKYQMSAAERDAWLPGVLAPYYTHYFHPDTNPVLDPTTGAFHLYYREGMLYVGLDTDDQAINGIEGENSRDGFRLTISSLDSLRAGLGGALAPIQFDFSIDSTGAVRYGNYAATLQMEDPDALQAAVSMKGASTVADPSDIDEGYQIEVALDMAALGYPADLDDRKIWLSLNFFDGDALDNAAQSYGTRIWTCGERAQCVIYGLLDADALIVTADEGGPDAGETLRALGTAPNPATGMTAVRYELARDARVTVEVYDVLGRRVQTIEAGVQTAGLQSAQVDASALAAGAYVYRVRTADGASVSGQMLVVR